MKRALDVDLVRQLWIALASGGEERREVEDHLDLVVRRDLVEQIAVHDVARVGLEAKPSILFRERREVDSDDAIATVLMHSLEKRAADFAVRSRDENHWLS